ncbi:MAG: class I SAM-dependent methyltransferase [Actinobacteria bacterium]|nr:class I SAM-dependent methyltransferase [Chloroflexota bacterium]MBE3128678.1 class I SAM-dependent methyltransferase [Actinomycetota bacterium]
MNAIEANKIVYTKAAEDYNKIEPHFFPENQFKVKEILKTIRKKSGPKLLDIGCGTGFIINLAKDLFDEIHGIDISEEMLNKVDISTGNIFLHKGMVEKLPFEKEYFDVVTSYAVLHHLENYELVLKEVYNVLKRGGYFYIDLEPNKFYIDMVTKYKDSKDQNYSESVKKEIRSICYANEKIEEDYGINGDIFNLSEFTRSVYGGIDSDDFEKKVNKIGFNSCNIIYDWFPAQGKVLHQQSKEDVTIIDNYLREMMPFSKCFYKYLRIILIK